MEQAISNFLWGVFWLILSLGVLLGATIVVLGHLVT